MALRVPVESVKGNVNTIRGDDTSGCPQPCPYVTTNGRTSTASITIAQFFRGQSDLKFSDQVALRAHTLTLSGADHGCV